MTQKNFLVWPLLVLLGAVVLSVFLLTRALAAPNPFDITYPVTELDNCKDQAACKIFCDDAVNAKACLTFARNHGFIAAEEADKAEKLANIKNGPGGCNSQASCESYCDDVKHIDECVAFGEANGLMQGKDLEEAKKIQEVVRGGMKLPGDCRNKQACESYCRNTEHADECLAFAKQAGFISEEEARQADKFLPYMKRGETPGGCQSKQECEAYCHIEGHFEACVAFGEKVGAISSEDAQRARATGGKGPGGCRGNECHAFCQNPENQKICFDFAKEHGFIKQEDMQRMEQGKQQMQNMLEQASPELKSCLETAVGQDTLQQFTTGQFSGQVDTGKMKSCFQQFPPKFEQGQQGEGQDGQNGFQGPNGPQNFSGPGGCTSREECEVYCQDAAHQKECQAVMQKMQPGFNRGMEQGQNNMPTTANCKDHPEECQRARYNSEQNGSQKSDEMMQFNKMIPSGMQINEEMKKKMESMQQQNQAGEMKGAPMPYQNNSYPGTNMTEEMKRKAELMQQQGQHSAYPQETMMPKPTEQFAPSGSYPQPIDGSMPSGSNMNPAYPSSGSMPPPTNMYSPPSGEMYSPPPSSSYPSGGSYTPPSGSYSPPPIMSPPPSMPSSALPRESLIGSVFNLLLGIK